MQVSESNSRSSSRFPLTQRKKHTDEKGKMKEKDDGEGSDADELESDLDGTSLSLGGSVPPDARWGPPRRKPVVGHPVGSGKVSTLMGKGGQTNSQAKGSQEAETSSVHQNMETGRVEPKSRNFGGAPDPLVPLHQPGAGEGHPLDLTPGAKPSSQDPHTNCLQGARTKAEAKAAAIRERLD